jgi:hypothetical protein
LKFAGLNKPLTNPSLRTPAFPSLRCRKCHFVIFDYTLEVQKGTVME